MHPFLINRPDLGLSVLSSVAAIYVAIALCLWWAPRWAAARENLPPSAVRKALLALALLVLAGGRVHFVMNSAQVYEERWLAAFLPWGGGFHIGGGMIALAVFLPAVVRRLGMPAGRFADGIVVPIAVAVVITRIGCLLQGCCIGDPCHGPWCVELPQGSAAFAVQESLGMLTPDAHHTLPVHALAIYFIAAAAAIAALASWLQSRRRFEGEVALVSMVLFSASTAAIEGLRATYGTVMLSSGRSQLQWTAIAMTAAFGLALAAAEWRSSRRSQQAVARELRAA